MSDLVHLCLEYIGEYGEPAAHIAVERGVPNSQFTLVSRGEQQVVELVANGHEDATSQPGLNILFRSQERRVWKECSYQCWSCQLEIY